MTGYYEGLPTGKAGEFGASINGDPVDSRSTCRALSYVDCARFVRHLALPGERIEVYGPRGVRRFVLSGPARLLRRLPA